MSLKLDNLESMIIDGCRDAFREIIQSQPEESFYAFALYTDESASGIDISANTLESLSNNIDLEVKWFPTEWKYEGGYINYFEDVNALLDEASDSVLDDACQYTEFQNHVVRAMIDCFKELKKENYFDTISQSKLEPALLVDVSDSELGERVFLESAKELNSEHIYNEIRSIF